MVWLSRVCRRLAVLIRRDRWDRDLEEEIGNHLAMEAEENRARGMDAFQARDAARRQFGNAALLGEDSREAWGWGPVERLAQDVRYATRVLGNNPGFAMVAILSLALGIGANTAVFTVVNAALLRALPVRDPRPLVILHSSTDGPVKNLWKQNSNDRIEKETGRRIYNTFPLAAIRDFRAQAGDTAEWFAFFSPGRAVVSDAAASHAAFVTLVSGNFFDGLGVPMALGRGLVEGDDQPGAGVMVITYSFWERTLGRDASILGKVLRLNGVPMAVVGVAGAGFHGVADAGFDGPADVLAPLSTLGEIAPGEVRNSRKPKTAPDYWWLQIMGRRRPGVSMEAAASRLTAVFRATLRESGVPALQAASNPRILPAPGDKGLDDLRDSIGRPLRILAAAVGIVLLLACTNLASLQLARSAARRREIAVRLSLGGGRGRIIRQLLIESLLLSACGAVSGVLLAVWGAPVIGRLLTVGPMFDSVALTLTPDLRVLGFTLAATVLTGLAFGLAPALAATRVDIAPSLKNNLHSTARHGALPMGKLLIAGQAALSLMLLAGSGLFLRTLGNLYNLDTGYASDHLLLFRLDPGQNTFRPEQAGPTYDAILHSIAATPGVRSVAAMSHVPIGGWRNSTALSSTETDWQPVETLMNTVSPGYFETVGMPIVAGRPFVPRDIASARPAAVLNQSAARRLCGSRPAVGCVLRRHMAGAVIPIEVVGVARDAKFESLRKPIEPTVFLLFTQAYPFTMRALAVRTANDPLAMTGAVRQAISVVNRDLVMLEVKTETGLIEESLHQERLFAALLTLFGGFALLLAAIGLHGVTAYSTARRTAEIGLRMALGAGRSRVVALVLRQVLRPVAAGILAGLAASLAATRWIESFLYGVKRLDPFTFGAALLLLLVVALAAAFLPAWRASRVDPMTALRAE